MRQMGFDLSRATCGRLLARVREVYGYEKPQGGGGARRAMPFAASERHEVWSADVRHLDMVDEGLVGGKAYAVAVMDNYSRAILASAVTRRQDLLAFLSVLYWAVERHGAPGTLVTDSGSVFLSNRAKAVYVKVGVSKEEIEKGRPWQNYSETTFGIQRRMADWHFARAESWAELAEAHDRFVLDYNAQEPLRPPAARGRVAEGSQAGGLRTQKLTPAGDASAGSLHLHRRHLAATQRRILFHRCESYTSQSL
jgi:putative transposase